MYNINWTNIKGYEGLYNINTNGDIFSIKRNIILKQVKDGRGYLSVNLCNNGDRKRFTIHRLVALTFLLIDLIKNEVNHKDGNKLNNNINNLEWCTFKENNNHALETGLNKFKLTDENIKEIRYLLNNTNMTLKSISIKYNVCYQHILKIKNGQRRKDL